MHASPRTRRLRNDRLDLEKLCADSSILSYEAIGDPAEKYIIRFLGKGLWSPSRGASIAIRDKHEVRINLGASYPRMMPGLSWATPIFHPNISASGIVCLGGYGTHWVPSLGLDELCEMLWDMIRYQNYDIDSPYNRDAAAWARTQTDFHFPLDDRPIRDKLAAARGPSKPPHDQTSEPTDGKPPKILMDEEIQIVEAEVIEPGDDGILFLD